MNTKKKDIIIDDNNIHDNSIILEIVRSNMPNESHKRQRIKEESKTRKEREGYPKWRKKIKKGSI